MGTEDAGSSPAPGTIQPTKERPVPKSTQDRVNDAFKSLASEMGIELHDECGVTGIDIIEFDLQNPGNAYIMTKLHYHYMRRLKDNDGLPLVTIHGTGPRLLGCSIVFVEKSMFIKGVI